MSLVSQAFSLLYPHKSNIYTFSLKYTRQFSDYNANIRKRGTHIEVRACAKWEDIGQEIQIGLYQALLMKIFKEKADTFYTQLYASFIRNLAEFTPKEQSDPWLQASFERVNAFYFNDALEQPNLCWGKNSTRQLGLYNYHNDTITISSIFKGEDEVIDFIMYHELLHKQEKFTHKNGRSHHHTKRFRDLEKQFNNLEQVEARMNQLVRKARRKRFW